jgi:hypothetical protein
MSAEERGDALEWARAGLEEMREPGAAVLEAMACEGRLPCSGHEWEFADFMAAPHWKGMIDALLNE